MIAQILFWLCISLLFYSYILYPLLVGILYRLSEKTKAPVSDLRRKVVILLAAHNEELVIEEKLNSINNSDYPTDKVIIYIGSDFSTDNTNELVQIYKEKSKYPNLKLHVAGRNTPATLINAKK